MERRDALKSLAVLAGATGMSLTPVTTKDAEKVTLIILKVHGYPTDEGYERLRAGWERAVEGTELEGVRVSIINSNEMDVEFVRG